MPTHLRSLADLSSSQVALPRHWLRDGWSAADALPTQTGPHRLRLRHRSGGFPPVDLYADWDGRRFVALRPDPYTAVPGLVEPMFRALLERFDGNAGQWDITAWIHELQTTEQRAVDAAASAAPANPAADPTPA